MTNALQSCFAALKGCLQLLDFPHRLIELSRLVLWADMVQSTERLGNVTVSEVHKRMICCGMAASVCLRPRVAARCHAQHFQISAVC